MIGTVLPSPRTRKAASILILLKGNSHWKGNMPNIRSSITVSWNPFGDHPCESLQGRGLVNLLWPYHQIDEVPYLVYSNLRWVCFTTRSWIVNFAFGNEHRITSTIRAAPCSCLPMFHSSVIGQFVSTMFTVQKSSKMWKPSFRLWRVNFVAARLTVGSNRFRFRQNNRTTFKVENNRSKSLGTRMGHKEWCSIQH